MIGKYQKAYHYEKLGQVYVEQKNYESAIANFEEANALKTPEHIAPVWYFTPFYSVLRAVPDVQDVYETLRRIAATDSYVPLAAAANIVLVPEDDIERAAVELCAEAKR